MIPGLFPQPCRIQELLLKLRADAKMLEMKLFLLIRAIVKRSSRDEITSYAGSVSFWLIISAVPFLMLIISLISHIPGLGREDVTDVIYSALPDMVLLHELVDSVLNNIYVSNTVTLISLSAVLTLWSASSGIYRLERAIRKINSTPHRKNYVRNRIEALFYTLLFMIAIILSLLLLVFGSAIGLLVMEHFPLLTDAILMFLDLKTIITAALLFLFIVFIYMFIPGVQDERRPVLPGAILATLAWILASYAFSIYFTYFKNISYMYGSLGALILLMFWLFAIICIILAGAEVNAVLYDLGLTSMPNIRAFFKE